MAIFRITDKDGETRDVKADWEPDDFVVAEGNDGKVRLYDTENNLDDPPPVSGQYVNEDEDLRESTLPNNVELIEGLTIDENTGDTVEEEEKDEYDDEDDDYWNYVEYEEENEDELEDDEDY